MARRLGRLHQSIQPFGSRPSENTVSFLCDPGEIVVGEKRERDRGASRCDSAGQLPCLGLVPNRAQAMSGDRLYMLDRLEPVIEDLAECNVEWPLQGDAGMAISFRRVPGIRYAKTGRLAQDSVIDVRLEV